MTIESVRSRYDATLTDRAIPYREVRSWDGSTVWTAGGAIPCRLAVGDPRMVEASLRLGRQVSARLWYSASGRDPLDGVAEVEVGGSRWSVGVRPARTGSVGRLAWLEEVHR